jgi:hypothetical protein
MSAFLYSLEHDLTPTLMVLAAVMFGAWTVAYAQIVYVSFREKTYGLPLVSILQNFSWEVIFSFQLVAPGVLALVWGNRLWFVVDCVIVLQVFLYGKQSQKHPWVRDNFYVIAGAALAFTAIGVYAFAAYFEDVYGLALSFLINLLMSVLFIAMLFERPDLKGLPYAAAWAKLIGTAAGAIFCYIWWPMQFDQTGTLVRPPYSHKPPNFYLPYFLYVTIPIVDAVYIYLHRKQQKINAAAQMRA